MDLTAKFLAAAKSVRGSLTATVQLESRLTRLRDEAHAAWPSIDIPDAAFMEHLARCPTVEGSDPLEALDTVHAADLYLALGCVRGDAAALRALEDKPLTEATRYLHQGKGGLVLVDDIKQALRERVLLSDDGRPPRIATYAGQGPLAGWLRVIAVRIAINMKPPGNEAERPAGDFARAMPGPAQDPEMAFFKSRYSEDVEAVLQATMALLTRRERLILRLHYLDELSAESIANLLDVSKRTVERWLGRARERILLETRERLAARLQIPSSQLDTLMGLVQSQLNPDLQHLLSRDRP